MAATRLRRTFQYPNDDSDDDAVEEGMDEQDQQTLLTDLSNRDTRSTNIYTLLLLILPLAPTPLYIPYLLGFHGFRASVAGIPAVASLLASAYTLYFLKLPPVRVEVRELNSSALATEPKKTKAYGKGTKDASASPDQVSFFSAPETREVPYISSEWAELLQKYVIVINAGVSVMLALYQFSQGKRWGEGMTIGGGYLPGFIFAVIMWARNELRVVDMGVLESLKYSAKGT